MLNDREAKLHLVNAGKRFNLPIMDVTYIKASRAWREYHAAFPAAEAA